MKFNNEELIFLLTIIKCNGNVAPLSVRHSYSEIIDEVKQLINKGWVNSDKELVITHDGELAIEHLLKEQKKLKRDWVQPYFQFRIDKVDEKFIYLPKEFDKL